MPLCWQYHKDHYAEGFAECKPFFSANLVAAKQMCAKNPQCTGLTVQRDVCGGKYRLVTHRPRLTSTTIRGTGSYTLDRTSRCVPPSPLCWAHHEGYYIAEGQGGHCSGSARHVEPAKQMCVRDPLCTGISKETDVCGGSYTVVRGGPTMIYYRGWKSKGLWSYTIDRMRSEPNCAAA